MRTVSGIQPTGNLHLGNYLGAIKNWVRMQDEGESLFFLADLHAITVHNEPKALSANTREMAAALIAAGVDPEKAILFNQARVSGHAELAWMLICNTPMGWLDRMTQFKEKSGKHKQRSSLGLYGYPVLQAADVLIYQATHVPVGEDQKQHLELAREIANSFNVRHFGEKYESGFFPLPEPIILKEAARVMSLRDGTKKMSKSDPSDMSRINLTDTEDDIAKKIRKAKTDPDALPSEAKGLEERAEARNLVNIYAGLADMSVDAVLRDVGGKAFSEFKPMLADLAVAKLAPISSEMARLMENQDEIDAILRKGADSARAIATPILEKTYDIIGMVR